MKFESSENRIFFLVLAVIFVVLLYCGIRAVGEDRENRIYFEQVNQVMADTAKGRHQEALAILNELEKKQPDDYRILWQQGISHFQTRNVAESERYLQRARKANPLIILEAVYLLQYAQVEAELGRYDTALAYLERFQQQAATEELRKEAAELSVILQKKAQSLPANRR